MTLGLRRKALHTSHQQCRRLCWQVATEPPQTTHVHTARLPGRGGDEKTRLHTASSSTNLAQPGPCLPLTPPRCAGSVLRLRLDTRQQSGDKGAKVPVFISYLKSYGAGNMGTATLR